MVVIALHKRPACTDGNDPAVYLSFNLTEQCRMEGATSRPSIRGLTLSAAYPGPKAGMMMEGRARSRTDKGGMNVLTANRLPVSGG